MLKKSFDVKLGKTKRIWYLIYRINKEFETRNYVNLLKQYLLVEGL